MKSNTVTRAQYRFYKRVSDKRLRLQKDYPERPVDTIQGRLDPIQFNLRWVLPAKSWCPVHEVKLESVIDLQWVQDPRFDEPRQTKAYLVQIEDEDQPKWMFHYELPPTPLLYEFDRERLSLMRFSTAKETDHEQKLTAEQDEAEMAIDMAGEEIRRQQIIEDLETRREESQRKKSRRRRPNRPPLIFNPPPRGRKAQEKLIDSSDSDDDEPDEMDGVGFDPGGESCACT